MGASLISEDRIQNPVNIVLQAALSASCDMQDSAQSLPGPPDVWTASIKEANSHFDCLSYN